MTKIFFLFILFSIPMAKEHTVVNFQKKTTLNDWYIVNDGVMGGLSQSEVHINGDGHLHFQGKVSLENNGGFASVQHPMNLSGVHDFTHITLRIKGDGRKYQFRLKSDRSQAHSYIHSFETSGEWETIVLPIADFYAGFRGRKLDMATFNFDKIAQITFLIADKKSGQFELAVDWIKLTTK